jgi:hypothetical protein
MSFPLKEVAVYTGHKVLVDVDDNGALVVGNPYWILGQQLRPHPIHLFNILFILI